MSAGLRKKKARLYTIQLQSSVAKDKAASFDYRFYVSVPLPKSFPPNDVFFCWRLAAMPIEQTCQESACTISSTF